MIIKIQHFFKDKVLPKHPSIRRAILLGAKPDVPDSVNLIKLTSPAITEIEKY